MRLGRRRRHSGVSAQGRRKPVLGGSRAASVRRDALCRYPGTPPPFTGVLSSVAARPHALAGPRCRGWLPWLAVSSVPLPLHVQRRARSRGTGCRGVTRHGRRVRAPREGLRRPPEQASHPACTRDRDVGARYSPSTSIMEYSPGGRPTTQRAAASAPRAKPERSWAWCASSICSPGPAKKTR